jgi:hypothetical protein
VRSWTRLLYLTVSQRENSSPDVLVLFLVEATEDDHLDSRSPQVIPGPLRAVVAMERPKTTRFMGRVYRDRGGIVDFEVEPERCAQCDTQHRIAGLARARTALGSTNRYPEFDNGIRD